jgi:hypothetical protein
MVMARKKEKKEKKEKDIQDQILDTVDFRGLTYDETAGKDGNIKQLPGMTPQRALALRLLMRK